LREYFFEKAETKFDLLANVNRVKYTNF
jgi:hypothetical protein